MIKVFLCLLASISLTSGQAPGDYNASCRTGTQNINNRMFPAEWKILLDTYDYRNLYDPANLNPVWTTRDVDGDGHSWSPMGSLCANPLFVCAFLTGGNAAQNNWMFSQFISYQSAHEVFFQIQNDGFRQCQLDPDTCSVDFLSLFRYDRNTVASSSERENELNYSPLFGTVESSRVEGTESGGQTQTKGLEPIDNFNGFYLGIRDEGTCGTIVRIIIYYFVCPARVVGLVNYAETPLPLQTGPNSSFSATCASNAYNVTSLEVILVSATHECVDEATGGAQCRCSPGYTNSSSTACEGIGRCICEVLICVCIQVKMC